MRESFHESLRTYFIAILLLKFFGFVRGVLFARFLGPEQYGHFTLLFGMVAIIEPLVVLGLPGAFTRFIPRYERQGNLNGFLRKTFFISILLSTTIALVLVLLSKSLSIHAFHNSSLRFGIILSACALPIFGLFHLIYSAYQGMRRFFNSAIVQVTQITLFLLIGFCAVLLNPSASAAMSGFLIATCAVCAIFLGRIFRDTRGQVTEPGSTKEATPFTNVLRFGVWILVIDIGYELFRYCDKFLINGMLSSAEVGIYTVAFVLTNPLFIIGLVIGDTIMPYLSDLYDRGMSEESRTRILSSVKVILITMSLITLCVCFFKEEIVGFLYGAEFSKSAGLIPYFCVYYAIFSVYYVLVTYAYLLEKPKIGAVAIFSGVALNVLINIVVIPRMGIEGAAYAAVFAVFGLVAILYVFLFRAKLSLDIRVLVLVGALIFSATGTFLSIAIVLGLILAAFTTKIFFNSTEKIFIRETLSGIFDRRKTT